MPCLLVFFGRVTDALVAELCDLTRRYRGVLLPAKLLIHDVEHVITEPPRIDGRRQPGLNEGPDLLKGRLQRGRIAEEQGPGHDRAKLPAIVVQADAEGELAAELELAQLRRARSPAQSPQR